MKEALEALVGKQVISWEYLDPGYEDHGTDVWRVQTEVGSLIVRACRLPAGRIEDEGGPFWGGLNRMFGHEPRSGHNLEQIFVQMEAAGGFRTPHLIGSKPWGERDALLVEAMQGKPLESLMALSPAGLKAFGRSLARQHARRLDGWGKVGGDLLPPVLFNQRLSEVMRFLAQKWFPGDEAIFSVQEEICQQALAMPCPQHCCLVMIDQDPSQYLTLKKRVSALVDLDAIVAGPRELDWIGLEYCLDQRSADWMCEGYASLLPLPDLAPVRAVYRYFYRLLEVQGDVPLAEWMAQPVLF